jgi:hypothetical protein
MSSDQLLAKPTLQRINTSEVQNLSLQRINTSEVQICSVDLISWEHWRWEPYHVW